MVFSQAIGYVKADRQALCDAYLGKSVSELPTPSCIINRTTARTNCESMLRNAAALRVPFRAHIKTHKTIEGLRLQMGEAGHGRVIVSTVMEAYSILPVVKEGLVRDVLYGLPLAPSRLPELLELKKLVPTFRLMIDSEDQLQALQRHGVPAGEGSGKWSIFIKVDCGTHRAGLPVSSDALEALIKAALSPDMAQIVDVYGFYCHAGHSYSDVSETSAKETLLSELRASSSAAALAKSFLETSSSSSRVAQTFVLSVGATPTAHASSALTHAELMALNLAGDVELHAGCYPFNDLQQFATGLVHPSCIAIRVTAEVVSLYHDRRELLINAGCIALSRESSRISGFGNVVKTVPGEGDDERDEWYVTRVSQEHGILASRRTTDVNVNQFSVGQRLLIVPQHACITGAGYPWYFIVDQDGLDAKIVDIWIRFNGW